MKEMKKGNEGRVKAIKDELLSFRAQALCIKTNIQILRNLWSLQAEFKDKNVGAFYKTVQENCIFRIVLETHKMLYDQTQGITISNMANDVYREMKEIEEFKDRQQELLEKKRSLASMMNSYKEVKAVIQNNRKKVYAHNDQEFYWFSQTHIDLWELTDDIYDSIIEIVEICIGYCNELLALLGEKCIVEYSNHDDVKRLFGIKTEKEEIRDLFYGYKKNGT